MSLFCCHLETAFLYQKFSIAPSGTSPKEYSKKEKHNNFNFDTMCAAFFNFSIVSISYRRILLAAYKRTSLPRQTYKCSAIRVNKFKWQRQRNAVA